MFEPSCLRWLAVARTDEYFIISYCMLRRAGLHAGAWDWRTISMRRFQTRFGSVTTREAPLRYPRIHFVGRRAVEAIFGGSERVQVAGVQIAPEVRGANR